MKKKKSYFRGLIFTYTSSGFFKKFEWRGKRNFPSGKWKVKRLAPRVLQTQAPRKNSETIIHREQGHTEGCGTVKTGRKTKQNKTTTQLLPLWGRESFICKDLGPRSRDPAIRTELRLTIGGRGASNKTKQKGFRKAQCFPMLALKHM